ncbi:uncharacterized protein LOC144627075 [Crassostrea virginica]
MCFNRSPQAYDPVFQTGHSPASVRHCERCLPGHIQSMRPEDAGTYVSTVQNIVCTSCGEESVPLCQRDYTVDNGMLEIPRLYPGDRGTYVWQAQNDFGQNEKDYYLSVGSIVNSIFFNVLILF